MKLQVIVGSIRPGRVSDRIAKWAATEAGKLEGAEVEIVDLQDYELPMFNEAIPPRYNPERKPEGVVKQWLDKLAEADGYVIVTPEYNRAITGVLKNALELIDFQMDNKPVAIVAHGSTGGAQAAATLRMTIPGVNAITVPNATYLVGRGNDMFSDEGELNPELANNPYGPATGLKATLDSLAFYATALKPAREQQ